MNKIEKILEDEKGFIKDIEINLKKITLLDDRTKLFIGFYRVALTHYISIIYLIEKKLYSSAFVLLRPLFESIIRGEYTYHILDDENIKRLYKTDNYDEIFKGRKLSKALDDKNKTNYFFKIYTSPAYKKMNDFIHTGAIQIAKSFNEDNKTIEANFDDELILDTINSLHTLITISSITYFKEIGLKNGEISNKDIENFINTYPMKEIQ